MVACKGAGGRSTSLMKISSRSGVLDSVDMEGTDDGQFSDLTDIATLPGGGLVALDSKACRFQVFTSLALRMGWITATVSWHSYNTRTSSHRPATCQKPALAAKSAVSQQLTLSTSSK